MGTLEPPKELTASSAFWDEMRSGQGVSAETMAATEAEAERLGMTLVRSDFLAPECRRLSAALAEHPDSPTFCSMSVCDDTGGVVGMNHQGDRLGMAFEDGAPSGLIVEAERLVAHIGSPDDRGYRKRAVRLAHLVRALNARLRRYSGLRRTLDTVTVVGPSYGALGRVDVAARRLYGAQRDAELATGPHKALALAHRHEESARAGPIPPLALLGALPIRRHGPPARTDRALTARMEAGSQLAA